MNASHTSRTKMIIGVLFFLSGASSLIYQVVWVRMLVVVFGTSMFAVSTVLAALMAGLALGSAYFGRKVDRDGKGLRLYAKLELGIGLFALAFPLILARLDDLYTLLYRLLEAHDYAFSLVRFSISFVVLLVPTTLMGATLPVLAKFVVQRISSVGSRVGSLYAVNTAGAVVGCAAAAFWLVEQFGVRETIAVAALLNLVIAAVAFLASRSTDTADGASRAETQPEPSPALSNTYLPANLVRLVFWGYALSGFTALGYEVVWTRLLSMILGITTTQSLSAILIVFLFGLALGAAIGARLADRFTRLFTTFGVLQLLLGLFGLGSIVMFSAIPGIRSALGPAFSWEANIVRQVILIVTVILPPTIVMGILFPVVGRIRSVGLNTLGRDIGDVYAVNTAGAIAGAFGVGFVFIPLIGTQASVTTLAWLNVSLGVGVIALDTATRQKTRLVWCAALMAPVLLLTLFVPRTLLVKMFAPGQAELLYYDEAPGGTVTVLQVPGDTRVLKVNGAGEVPTDHASIQTFRLLGNLPMLLHEAAEEILVIAFGGGITLSSVEQHHPKRIDCAEIVPGVFEAARYFSEYNNNVADRLESDQFDLIRDDGRNHVLRTERTYDVIISDSTHPSTSDSWVLYSEEFYRLCQKRLNRDGIVAQWLPLHGLTVDDYKIIVRTFRDVFPHATVWMTKGYSVLLATPSHLKIDFSRLRESLAQPDVRASLNEVDLVDPVSFVSTLVLDEERVARFVGDGPINTDNHPHISFGDRLRSGTQTGIPATLSLLEFYGPDGIERNLTGCTKDDVGRLQARIRARRHTLLAEVAMGLGDRMRAFTEVQKATALDPGEPGARRLLHRLLDG